MSDSSGFSYVVPLRWDGQATMRAELAAYLERVGRWGAEVIVVDGSPPAVFAANARAWGSHARHLPPDPAHRCLNGKVAGVLTGVDLARHERMVLADDDVRFDREALLAVIRLLDDHQLVRPQNYFAPTPWHARWDTARILLNRAWGDDFPGTLAVRRSMMRAMGGYDGDVIFENLELIRSVEAYGGRTLSAPGLFVARLPPTAAQFWSQRTRQAYDDFAIPFRMALWLSLGPAAAIGALRRRSGLLLAAALTAILTAEHGRRKAGGAAVFPAVCSLLAPVWILERAVCCWLAVLQRLRFGGIRYRGRTIPLAAHLPSQLGSSARH